MSDKQKFAFDKVNFILLAVGMAIVIIGPVVCLFGFLSMIYAVLRKPKTKIE